jgi:hypothetical protein
MDYREETMPKIHTCGSPARRSQFTYIGDFDSGVTIHYASGKTIKINHGLMRSAIDYFRGREVKGGFSMTNPTSGGFGQWIENNSKALNTTPLNPRHGSFIAAILQEMDFLQSRLDGNAIILKFGK